MKVTVASSGLGHVARGIEAWAADLGAALAERGVDVTLCQGGGRPAAPWQRVISCWQRDAQRTQRALRWLPRRFVWRLGLASGYGLEQTTFAVGLIQHLRRVRADILHVQDPQLAALVQRAARLGLVQARVILGHGTEESLAFLRQITYLQHLAPWHLEEARAAGVWKPTWTAIPNFIDVDVFRPGERDALRDELGIPREGLVVLTAAAIKRSHKRIDYLIDEFARLRTIAPELPVWLVVAGGWEQETDDLVRWGREQLGDRVRFAVGFPRDRMPDLYRAADAFVLCSLKEMMPIALLEATASGLPCVVHRHPVVEWIVGPGGEAVDMAHAGQLSDALDRLLADEPSRRRMGERARQHCVDNFSRASVVDQIQDYYTRVLTQHDTRTAKPASAAGARTESVVT